jgi:hypothetical protein
MYYIPAGILAKGQKHISTLSGVTGEIVTSLDWYRIFPGESHTGHFGQYRGGGLLVAGAYFLAYRKG